MNKGELLYKLLCDQSVSSGWTGNRLSNQESLLLFCFLYYAFKKRKMFYMYYTISWNFFLRRQYCHPRKTKGHITHRLSAAEPQAGCDNISDSCSFCEGVCESQKEFLINEFCHLLRSSLSPANRSCLPASQDPLLQALLVLCGGIG